MKNALVIDNRDTVAVIINPVEKGEKVYYEMDKTLGKIISASDIEIYHKIAIKEMRKGDPVIKYGEHIGIAASNISVGEHVHVHNVESHRENLEEVAP